MMTDRRARAGLALAAMLLLCVACDDSPTDPAGPAGFETVLKTSLRGEAPDLRGREAVRDRAAWQTVWAELHRGTPPPLPAVDFSREMVVVALGFGCNGSVDISAIDREGGELVVHAHTRNCGNKVCGFVDFSVHVVRLLRSDAPVRVRVTGEPGLC